MSLMVKKVTEEEKNAIAKRRRADYRVGAFMEAYGLSASEAIRILDAKDDVENFLFYSKPGVAEDLWKDKTRTEALAEVNARADLLFAEVRVAAQAKFHYGAYFIAKLCVDIERWRANTILYLTRVVFWESDAEGKTI